jgi:hypothetical protein
VNQIRPQHEFVEGAPIIRGEAEPLTRDEVEASERAARAKRVAERTAMLQRNLNRIHKATWALSGVAALLLVLAVALIIVSVRISSALSESRQIAQQLDHLEQFESRILGRLDSFNAGVQSLIGKTNDAIYNVRDEVEQTAKAARDASEDIKATASQLQSHTTGVVWPDAGNGQPPVSPVRRSVPRLADAVAETAPAMSLATPEKPSMAFRRIINPDGSTTYQTVR